MPQWSDPLHTQCGINTPNVEMKEAAASRYSVSHSLKRRVVTESSE